MARPRSFDRDAALEIALEAFWSDGYDRVGVARLSQAMGIAAPSLYAAFGDKRALYDEAVALYSKRLDAGLERTLSAPSARDAIADLLQFSVERFTAAGTPPGCLVMGEPQLSQRRRTTRDAVRDRLRRAVPDGELESVEQADSLASYVNVVLAGLAAHARDGVPRDELSRSAAVAMAAWPPSRAV